MKELLYQVEFLSDIVLPATSNTEGNISQLDFIPGSNFLGMVAVHYDKFENSFDMFHNGAVKFGDATILKDNKITYKMPLSYFHKKLDDTTIYNHHKIEEKEFQALGQLKQLRAGYITKNKKQINIDYNYSQKSAYDKETRTSKEGSMYGYNAIQSGTTWQFSIKIDDTISSNDLELLQKSIVGQKRLGKSKSAQYGLINIESKGVKENIEDKDSDQLILYANSRLALFDEYGNPTYDLKYLFDGLSDENIDYKKCQIKTSTFTPYNRARETKDYERVCINKGSVIVLKNMKKENIPDFVGAYQSEGFGELLLNPKFLIQDKFEFVKESEVLTKPKKVEPTSNIALFLQQREDTKKDKINLGIEVSKFKEDNKTLYKKIKNSQWGTIRSICTKGDDDFKQQIQNYISSGKVKWEDKQIDTLINHSDDLNFFKLLSIQMPKGKSND